MPGRPTGKSSRLARKGATQRSKPSSPAEQQNRKTPRDVRRRPAKDVNAFPVVVVGASAGGLDAFTRMLQHLPVDTGMAFVFIQHLDPQHASHLPELLARVALMPIVPATDGLRVKPNQVYVIPANARMSTSDGVLRLKPRVASETQPMPIDEFCQSLAHDRGPQAVGVVLSGTGSDGTLGLKAIKAEGGITFAQTLGSAKFDAMPRSAIAAGVADFVLTPEQIAQRLAELREHPYVSGTGRSAPQPAHDRPESEDALRSIVHKLRLETGLDFSAYKPASLGRRIQRRMLLAGVDTLADYAEHVRLHPPEVMQLYQDIFIHVTHFFRDGEIYESLKRKVFPKLEEKTSGNVPVRIWAAGCSTGEEAYSLAIAWLEFAAGLTDHVPVQIFATDISPASIDRARAGRYPDNVVAQVSPERLRRFFVKVPGGYQIAKPVRDMCVFAPHNLIQDPPFTQLDLICCRNVLIYLEPEYQKRLFELFHYSLKNTGFLVLGLSEDIGRLSQLFSPLDKKHRIYAKKPATGVRPYAQVTARLAWGRAQPGRLETDPTEAGQVQPQDVWAEADQLVMAKYAPVSVVVNEDLEILQYRGHVGPFLEPALGPPTHNLRKMAREGLQHPILSLIRKAKAANAPVRQQGLAVRKDGGERRVNLEVIPFQVSRQSHERFFLVVFEEAAQAAMPGAAPGCPARPKARRQASATAQWQRELEETRQGLQAIIEERDASNAELTSALEELQSANEELQSTNEEMQTAKEELQSTNEELATLNEELENRNRELGQVLANQNNLLESVRIPIVMVGADLRIRLYNPAAERVLNVVDTDIGRSLSEVKTRLNIPELEQLITEVTADLTSRSQEVQDREGRWYEMRVRPFKSYDNKIDGAILTWTDISAHRANLEAMMSARDYLAAIVATVDSPLLVLDSALRVKSANRLFYELFQTRADETEHRLFYELGNGRWDIPELRQRLAAVLPQKKQLHDFEVELDVPELGRRALLLNARRLEPLQEHSELILLTVRDVTAIRQLAYMEQLRQLPAHLQAVREEERTSLAREVHDELGSQLTALKMDVVRLSHGLNEEQTALREIAHAMSSLVDTSIETVRRIASSLRPSVLDDLGLMAAIQWQLAEFQKRTGLDYNVSSGVEAVDLNPESATAIFRVFQESLTNIARHAQASRVAVSLEEQAGHLILEVQDNGRGITNQDIRGTKSLGLVGMRERIERLNGDLDIRGEPGQGTAVRVRIPLGYPEANSQPL